MYMHVCLHQSATYLSNVLKSLCPSDVNNVFLAKMVDQNLLID
jgi:hypothetical protein